MCSEVKLSKIYATLLRFIFAFAGGSKTYSRHARVIGEARNDLRWDGLRFDCAKSLGIRSRPNALLKAVEGKLAFFQYRVSHRKDTSSPFADLALHDNLIIEPARA